MPLISSSALTSIETLAQKSTGAGLGTRQKPLAKFTRYAVSELVELPYKKELDEVLAMADRIAKSSPPEDVAAAASDCSRKAKATGYRRAPPAPSGCTRAP